MGKLFMVFILSTSGLFADSVYDFGGSCSTKAGYWTGEALKQSNQIREAVNKLKNNPACQGIETILQTVEASTNEYKEGNGKERYDTRRFQEVTSEINSLHTTVKSIKAVGGEEMANKASSYMSALMGDVLENAMMASGVGAPVATGVKTLRTLNTGMSMLDQTVDLLPQYDECLFANPSQAAMLIGATVKLTAAFVGSDQVLLGQLSNTISKLITFMKNKKFSRILKQLNESEFWLSLSCIIETTTDTYCSAKDGYEMLKLSQKESKIKNNILKNEDSSNPLQGYYLMIREVEIVSEWLQKVQFGVKPRLQMDASFKNVILDNVNGLLKMQNELLGYYNDNIQILEKIPAIESKKNHVLKMLSQLVDKLDNNTPVAGSGGESMNFFTMSVFAEKLPFYLIGRPEIPDVCKVSYSGGVVQNWKVYMQDGGKFQEEFNDPDELARKIGKNLEALIDQALNNGSSYYQQRLIIDISNLVDESLTSQTITVVDSLTRIEKYLENLEERVRKVKKNLAILPNLINTRERIEAVLDIYREIEERLIQLTEENGEDKKLVNQKINNDEVLKKAMSRIIQTAYEKFNVLFQRDSFLKTRMSTFVRFDYADRIKNSTDFNKYQKELLIISGKNLIDQIGHSFNMKFAQIEMDLNTAQVVNKKNLIAVEELFLNTLIPVVSEVGLIASGKGNNPGILNQNSISRWMKDSSSATDRTGFVKQVTPEPLITPFATAFKAVTNLVINGERYPIHVPSLRKIKNDDDVYGSFRQFHAKLCVQSLAFESKYLFREMCQKAVLKNSGADEDDKDLALNYDEYLNKHTTITISGDQQKIRESRDKNICALRDYKRKNHAHWLLKEFEMNK